MFFLFFGDIDIFKFFNEPLEKKKKKKNYEAVTNHEMDKKIEFEMKGSSSE